MDTFFQPASIAVVGASDRREGNLVIKNLLYGYRGQIYPVNPNHRAIEGLPCYPSLEEIPTEVELAIILVPAPAVPSVLEACARKGVLRVMIQSAGFAEVGQRGQAIQNRCLAISKESHIRIWGPNCMGLVDVPRKYFFTFMNPGVYEDGLIAGRISLIVQSGMLSAIFLAELNRRSIGVGKVCSIGNKADVDECDLLRYLLQDTETDVVALYLESIPRGRLFAEIAREAIKPIVVLNGGRSQAGARAAMSHTCSLAGNSRLVDSVLQMSGVTLANDIYQMMDLAKALDMIPEVKPTGRTAILTMSGGAGILCCDVLERHGLRVARLSERTEKVLSGIFPDWMPVANPVDLFPAVRLHGRVPTYNQAISVLLEDPNVDVLLIHYVAGLEGESLDLGAIKNKADREGRVVLFWLMGRGNATKSFRREAQSRSLVVHWEISRAVECLSAAVRRQCRQRRNSAGGSTTPSLPLKIPQESVLTTTAKRVLDEYESKRLLDKWEIPVVEEILVSTLSEAQKAAQRMGFPVALKGLLPGEMHKTERGLIQLGIASKPALKNAYQKITEKLTGRGRILLQRQVEIDYELIAGFVRDDQFGPCIMFGLGGILSELQPDVVFACAPLKRLEALELIRNIQGRRLLEGFRGMAPLDQERMADILINLGDLGRAYPQIEQIDINPVAVRKGLALALDANLVVNPSG
ncbi:MAG: acetate--CoA ligase family protein [Deltaproteobacteria bacterium]|nr:MAG: acetate--CoA ligase family protein [Deltaproteobacteria bacterium]